MGDHVSRPGAKRTVIQARGNSMFIEIKIENQRQVFSSGSTTLVTLDMASAVSSASTSAPRLHVTARLPPVISFSGIEVPQFEMDMTLQHSWPIIIALKQSRLWPLHLRSVLIVNHASSHYFCFSKRNDVIIIIVTIPFSFYYTFTNRSKKYLYTHLYLLLWL